MEAGIAPRGRRGPSDPPEVDGIVDSAFALVADEFRANFVERGEIGAAVALYVGGRKVVDLWAGVADKTTGRRWTEDTPAVVFSCTKGLMAICVYSLVQKRLLDLDAPVSRYWPEFGRAGKERIPVRWVLSHRAGLPAVDRVLSSKELLVWDPVVRALEDQRPLWEPGTAHAYHANTYGWLVGEVIARITGRSPGTYFRETFARPLSLHTWIGMPLGAQQDVARTEASVTPTQNRSQTSSDVPERALTLNGALTFPDAFNDPAVRAAEIPAGNGISTARSLAKIFAACVTSVDGARILTRESLDDALRVQSSGPQLYGPVDGSYRWGTGFMLDSPPARPMLGPRSFGHDGAGGQLAFGDDEFGVGFAYVTNQMGGVDDDRSNRLTAAVRSCLRLGVRKSRKRGST
jgi:CubicO group peptidase (beta-lactamase class C family)